MNIFQRAYNFFRDLELPTWLKLLLQNLNDDILMPLLKSLGEEAVEFLKKQVILESAKPISGTDKFNNVIKGFRAYYSDISITDRALNLAIELVVSYLTKKALI